MSRMMFKSRYSISLQNKIASYRYLLQSHGIQYDTELEPVLPPQKEEDSSSHWSDELYRILSTHFSQCSSFIQSTIEPFMKEKMQSLLVDQQSILHQLQEESNEHPSSSNELFKLQQEEGARHLHESAEDYHKALQYYKVCYCKVCY